jgi:hypothetical protein
MHFYDEESAELALAIVKYAMERIKMDPPPLDKPYTLNSPMSSLLHASVWITHCFFRLFLVHRPRAPFFLIS